MFRKILAVLLVVLCLFSLTTPAFATDSFIFPFNPLDPLTREALEGVFWSMASGLGIRSDLQDAEAALASTLDDLGPGSVLDKWIAFTQMTEIQAIWDEFKNDIRELGTVHYTDGKTVPRWGIEVTAQNANAVKKFAKTIQDWYAYEYNPDVNPDWVWTDINQQFGGYLNYAEQYIGNYVQLQTYSTTSYWHYYPVNYQTNSNVYYRSLGLDVFGYDSVNDLYAKILEFDPGSDTVTFLNDPQFPGGGNFFGKAGSVEFSYFAAMPLHVSGTVEVTLDIFSNGAVNSGGQGCRWRTLSVLTQEQYASWLNRAHTGDGGWPTGSQPTVYEMSAVNGTQNSTVSGTLSTGEYMIVGNLVVAGGRNYRLQKLTPYNITNEFNVTYDDVSIYDVMKIDGVYRGYSWNVDITDSGTGTTITVPDAISSPYEDLFTPGSTIYFPGTVSNGLELADLLNSDMVQDGEIAAEAAPPSDPSEGSVTVDLVPPASLGLASIWHYVVDSYTYVADYISVMVSSVFTVVPTPVFNIAFAAVVLGILFGLYKRFIE